MSSVDRHSLPPLSHPTSAIRNNGSSYLTLERYKLRELAEGWPMYRDYCEWDNFASLFHPDAHVYTTWSGRVHYQKFIEISQAGMDKGAFIMHRCCGVSTDIEPGRGVGGSGATRAVTKMKAVITQRFVIDGCEVDVEADCRFCFFWERTGGGKAVGPGAAGAGADGDEDAEGEWRARLVRHWYEKDKMIPVNPNHIPMLDEAKLATYPPGYKILAYCQEATMDGVKVIHGLPGHRRENAGTPSREAHDKLVWACKGWLEEGTLPAADG